MRRADRLFQIVQFLRSRRVTTAKWLAQRLGVSERTIYRDIQDLSLSGVPIEAETGIGYCLRLEYNLPPLMFTQEEINALVLGARMVAAQGGALQHVAEQALSKIHTALPHEQKQQLDTVKLFAPDVQKKQGQLVNEFNQCILEKKPLLLQYKTLKGKITHNRTIYPLGLFFWGDKWTLVAWCCLRDDFRHFRIDQVISHQRLDYTFQLAPHQQLKEFFRMIQSCNDKYS
ncbi:helix-turn-helix transcriptional regulator [Neisseria sp. Ec49-e6-T10]|uniref:helix-turn-helix transcriptional regulator n=1 Tax=Neisseria sp. Ec49-e6-T10 TaxID=3140744 RepID=UPI003EBC8D07